MLRYALDNLGWFEFESLVQTLLKVRLGMGVEAWGGHGDWGRDAYFQGALRYPTNDETAGPFVFQAKFVDAANSAGADPDTPITDAVRKECRRICDRLLATGSWKMPPAHYVLLTNAPLAPSVRTRIERSLQTALPQSAVHLHDGGDICQWLNSTRQIVRSFPQLLSLRDLNELLRECVDASILARSETAIAMAESQAKVFVPTQAYSSALQCLQKRFFVVLEGPPEMGKTTIGRIIALAQLSQGWEAIECRNPDELLRTYRGELAQVFVCDDFFGRTEYDPSRVSSWQTDLPHVIPRLNSSHWLILTTRAHLLEMAKPNLDVAGHNDQFLTLGEVLVDAGKLTTGEKARILYRHAKAAGLGRPSKDIIKRHAMRVISNPHFTPERIRRLVTSGLGTLSNGGRAHGEKEIEKRIDAAINDPTKQMRTSFRALPVRHRWLLYALLETEERTPIFTMEEGTVAETLEERFERLCPQEHQEAFASVAAEMSEAFVKRLPALFGEGRISWIHPSVRDLAIGELRANGRERRRFLSRCSGQGLQLATSLAGGEMGLREMPLLSDEEDWEIFKARCIALINEGRISSACCGGTSKRRGKLKGQTLRLG